MPWYFRTIKRRGHFDHVGFGVDTDQQRMDWLRLTAAQGIGPRTARLLLGVYGDASSVLTAADRPSPHQFAEVEEVTPATRSALAAAIARSHPEEELSQLAAIGGDLIPFDDPRYSSHLMTIPDPPAVLRAAGAIDELNRCSVAIVGTRRCSPDGLVQAGRFASGLAASGVQVVSGGARGIDGEAHRATLRSQGRTVVVLGSGLGRPYPDEHRALFDDVRCNGGAIVSELPTDQPPRPSQFPRRNRIISGLSQGVLVVEAPVRSGAMLTARIAVESHGRGCWAVPWSPRLRSGRGGLEALRDGWAAMAIDPADVLGDLPERTQLAARRPSVCSEVVCDAKPAAGMELSAAQQGVAEALRRGGRTVGAIVDAVRGPAGETMRAVTSLELLGVVSRRGMHVSLTPAGLASVASRRRDQS